MLGTLMTALYFMVKALTELSDSLFQEEPLPYLVHQPLPWQVQCVTQNHRASRDAGKGGSPRHSGRRGDTSSVASSKSEELGDPPEQAAVTTQTYNQKCHQHLRHEK